MLSSIIEHLEKASSEYAAWIKNLTPLSIGALTVLISMMPQKPPEPPANYFLATCWILLAISILCSLAASFRPIIQSQFLASAAMDVGQAKNKQNFPGSDHAKRLHKLNKVLLISQVVAISTFCFSFISLAIYACISIL